MSNLDSPAFDLVVTGELNVDLLLYGEDVTPAFGRAESSLRMKFSPWAARR